jgi:hypothetical protein
LSGGTSGTGRRGGLAGNDEQDPGTGTSWVNFRQEDPLGAFASASTRLHIAGLSHTTPGAAEPVGEATAAGLSGGVGSEILYAVPQYFNVAARLKRALCKINANPDGFGRIGIYTNADLDIPYPGSLLEDSGDLDFSVAGVHGIGKAAPTSHAFDANELFWLVWICDGDFAANNATVMAIRAGNMYPILGSTLTDAFGAAADKASFAVGWRHAFTWAAGTPLPDLFPTSAPVRILQEASASVNVPALYYGWNRA